MDRHLRWEKKLQILYFFSGIFEFDANCLHDSIDNNPGEYKPGLKTCLLYYWHIPDYFGIFSLDIHDCTTKFPWVSNQQKFNNKLILQKYLVVSGWKPIQKVYIVVK